MSETLLANLHEHLKEVRTQPLFVLRLAVRRMVLVGETPNGFRRIGVVSGGSFSGERLSGSVQEGGSDWQHVRKDNSTTLDVRLTLETLDGALINMTYRGLRSGAPEVIARLEKGEVVDPTTYYFRTHAQFETAAPKYEWINRLLALAIGQRTAQGPIYSVFEIL